VNPYLRQAFETTAAHFGIDVSDVRRRLIRQAREEGAELPPERKMYPRGRGIEGHATGPFPTVPEGYEAARITTGPRGQSVQARPLATPAEEPPEGFELRRISRLTRGDGAVLNTWEIWQKGAGPDDLIQRVIEDFDGSIPRAAPTPAPVTDRQDLLTVYPIGDPHIGLRGLDGSGLMDGAELLGEAVADLVRRGTRTHECLIVNLGDYYHSDDPSNKTRRSGNPLDVDGDWFEILKVGRDLFLALIAEALEHHEIVNVKCMIGNHDDLSSIFLTLLIDAHFRDETRVRVDVSGAAFQWFEWGQNLFGFTHGQACKTTKLPSKMAHDQREAWGRTLHRYWLVGHVHHTRKAEIDGVLVESFRTLAPRDAWHEAAGYISGRDLTRIVYHKDHGEVSRETVSAAMVIG